MDTVKGFNGAGIFMGQDFLLGRDFYGAGIDTPWRIGSVAVLLKF